MHISASTFLKEIRATRSAPPGKAGEPGLRREIYSASLQQFEELLASAEVAGPASRPLPLFYALTQATKAIVAVHGDVPSTKGHGLKETTPTPADDRPVKLLSRAVTRTGGRTDTLTGLIKATDSGEVLGDVQLGALWGAIPGTPRLPRESWEAHWRTCLSVTEDVPSFGNRFRVMAMESPGDLLSAHVLDVGTARYPGVPPSGRIEHGTVEMAGELWTKASLFWPGPIQSVKIHHIGFPDPHSSSERQLRPLLPGHTELTSPIVLWWMLLFGLSILARYEPATWQASLRVDECELAVSLEWVLERALEDIPRLVYDALLGLTA